MSDQPKPGPNRKRQLAGFLLVWLICYPLSYGPYQYALGRGWVPGWVHRVAHLHYYPAFIVVTARGGPTPVEDWSHWVVECFIRGERDRLER